MKYRIWRRNKWPIVAVAVGLLAWFSRPGKMTDSWGKSRLSIMIKRRSWVSKRVHEPLVVLARILWLPIYLSFFFVASGLYHPPFFLFSRLRFLISRVYFTKDNQTIWRHIVLSLEESSIKSCYLNSQSLEN